jgi:hypothetical protein
MSRSGMGRAAALTLALASASALAQDVDPIALRFAWPDRIVLQVERAFERTTEGAGGIAPKRSTSRFTWTGTRSDEGYRLAFSDHAVVLEEPPPTSSAPLVQLEYAQRRLEPLLPTLIFDASAAVLRVEGLAELRERLREEYAAIPGLAEGPKGQQLLAFLTSEELLTERALEDWNRAIEPWHGMDAELGAEEEQEVTADAMGATIRNVLSYRLDRRVPCAEATPEPACVRMILTHSPRFSDTRNAVRALLGFDPVEALDAGSDAEVEIRNTYTTDTDPATLVPVRYVKEKRWSIRWLDAKGVEQRMGRTDRWTYSFSRVE